MAIGIGSRVSWVYQGVRTFGRVTGTAGKRATITTQGGGQVVRIAQPGDPVLELKSESTGGKVLKLRSELREAPLKKNS
jgi:hypothetical protein